MLKQHKWLLLVTSILILLPIIAGLYLWKELPQQIAIHFGMNNAPNGWCSKPFAVFGLPAILLMLHWFVLCVTAADPKHGNIGRKLILLLFWLCPVLSLVLNAVVYSYAMGMELNVGMVAKLLIGILLIVLGNFQPKCKPNYSAGIRTPWALNDPENWRKTHRVAGWTMTISGILILATAYWDSIWFFLSLIVLAVLIPYLFSFVDYQRHKA